MWFQLGMRRYPYGKPVFYFPDRALASLHGRNSLHEELERLSERALAEFGPGVLTDPHELRSDAEPIEPGRLDRAARRSTARAAGRRRFPTGTRHDPWPARR